MSIIEPKLLNRSSIKIAGYVLKTSCEDGENLKAIPEFWWAYMKDGRMAKLHGEYFLKNHAEYGVCLPADQTGAFEYVIGVEVKDAVEVSNEYRGYEIPAARYAVFSSPPGDSSAFTKNIQETWHYIFAEWFPQSGYNMDEKSLSFELYDERSWGEAEKICDIYIPVIEKQPE